MLKKEAMAWMMPVRMEATPFTMAIRQLPMARNMPWICLREPLVTGRGGSWDVGCLMISRVGRDPASLRYEYALARRSEAGYRAGGEFPGPGT